jgi:hypothetical protein
VLISGSRVHRRAHDPSTYDFRLEPGAPSLSLSVDTWCSGFRLGQTLPDRAWMVVYLGCIGVLSVLALQISMVRVWVETWIT